MKFGVRSFPGKAGAMEVEAMVDRLKRLSLRGPEHVSGRTPMRIRKLA